MASRRQYELEVLLGAKTAASFNSSINRGRQGMKSLSSTAKKAAALVTGAFAAVNITGFVKDAVEVYSGFEQELAGSAAIAGATGTEYKKMEKASREAGKATIKTAQESASALGYMALAGWDVNESTQGLMPVLKLSAATNLDLARTSDLVTDSMSALKLNVNELPEYLDLVTKANNSANTTSEQLMEAFIKSGGAARTLKMDVKDSAVALGILANNGTKAEEGGRTLNAILTRIASNKNALMEMKDLNINIFEDGKFVGLEEALKRINKGIAGLSVEEKAKALKNIAGTNYYSKMAYLLDGVKNGAKGAESAWDDLEGKLDDSDGTLDDMYTKMTDTMSGATETMKSAFDDAKISFADAFDGEMVEVLNGLGGAFNMVSESIADFAEENEVEIHQTFEEIKEGVLSVGEKIGDFAGFVAEHSDVIISGIAGIGKAIVVYKVASGIAGIATSLAALASSPVGLIAGAGAVIAGLGVYASRTHDKMVKAGLEEHFGNISLSLEEIDEIAQEIVGKKKLTRISAMLESIGKTDDSIENMKDSLAEVNKISWKLNAGFEISKDDKESYSESLKDYIQYAQNTLDQKAYTVHIATDFLLGENSKIGQENDVFYSGLDDKLGRLKKRLQKKIKQAVKNGVDIDTDEAIQKLLGKIGNITDSVTQAQNDAALQTLELKYSGKDLTPEDFEQLSKDIQKYEEQVTSGAEEAYSSSMTTLNARLNTGDISQKKYDKEAQKLKQGYFKTQSNAAAKGSEYMLNTIMEAYPELGAVAEGYQGKLREAFGAKSKEGTSLNDLTEVSDFAIRSAWDDPSLAAVQDQANEAYQYGLKDLREKMAELMARQENSGFKVSDSVKGTMDDIRLLSALTGDANDAYESLGEALAGDDKFAAMVQASEEVGGAMPEGLKNGMDNNSERVKEGAENLVRIYQETVKRGMEFVVTPNISFSSLPGRNPAVENLINASRPENQLSQVVQPRNAKKSGGSRKQNKILSNAEGGIYYSPILTTFAEEGPEAAIPLDGSRRAKALWKQAGEILGMMPAGKGTALSGTVAIPGRDKELYRNMSKIPAASSDGSSGVPNIQISYAPVIEVKGNADEHVLTKVVRMSQAEFAEMMKKYELGKRRTSFAH